MNFFKQRIMFNLIANNKENFKNSKFFATMKTSNQNYN